MANLYDKASLVLPTSPAYKDGAIQAYKPLTSQGTFDFTRGSNLAATRVDVNGLIEKGRENIALYSNAQTNAVYDISNQIQSVTAVSNPITGNNDAYKIVKSAGGADPYYGQTISNSTSGCYTGSMWVWTDSGQPTDAQLFLYDAGATEVFSKGITITTTPTRYEVFANFASTGGSIRFRLDLSTDTNAHLYTYGWQLEQSVTATDYIETGASTAQAGILEDMPRLDYSGGASCPALLLEPQRSNYIAHSEYIGAATSNNITTIDNSATSPEGVTNAASLIPTTANALHYIDFLSAYPTTIANYTFSIYAKANGANYIYMRYPSPNAWAGFNLSTGVKISENGFSADIEDAGNGWYRIYGTINHATGNSKAAQIFVSSNEHSGDPAVVETQDGTSGVLTYGAQLEQGSYPTSYIPTYGSSVTRGADVALKTGIDSLIGQTEGVVYFEWDYQNIGSSGGNIVVSLAGASLQELYFWVKTDGSYVYDVYDSTKQAGITGSIGSFGIKKIALVYKNNDFALYINGVLVGSDTSGSVPTLTDVYIGKYALNNNYNISSGIKQVVLFNERLTNAELAALTTL